VPTPRPTFIVGIGGSAGGLAAYQALLDALPSDTGMAFVIISHILPSASYSLLADILRHHTKMAVRVASAAMPVSGNQVYVIPPNVDLRVEDDAFKVTSPRTMNKQVDIFFKSLAASMKTRAIGVILSGYDGDGSEGCAEIKEKGGTTFAQDTTAKVGSMPLSAQATGSIDFVLSAGEIGKELQKLAFTVSLAG